MKRNCRELKRISRETLSGHYGIPMGVFLIANTIIFAIGLPFSMLMSEHASAIQTITYYIARVLILLIGVVLSSGQKKIHLQMARKQNYDLFLMFYCFKNQPQRYLLAGFLTLFISLICSIPAIIGAVWIYLERSVISIICCILFCAITMALCIWIQLSIQLIYYFLLDHEDITVKSAFQSSLHLMKGNRGRLLYIYCSFLGMELLSLISLGIGYLWVKPYESQTFVNFYLEILGELPDAGTAFDQTV